MSLPRTARSRRSLQIHCRSERWASGTWQSRCSPERREHNVLASHVRFSLALTHRQSGVLAWLFPLFAHSSQLSFKQSLFAVMHRVLLNDHHSARRQHVYIQNFVSERESIFPRKSSSRYRAHSHPPPPPGFRAAPLLVSHLLLFIFCHSDRGHCVYL